jgi:hypothetical protein
MDSIIDLPFELLLIIIEKSDKNELPFMGSTCRDLYIAVQYLHKDLIQKPYLLCSSRSRYRYARDICHIGIETALYYAAVMDDLDMVKYISHRNAGVIINKTEARKASISNENIQMYDFLGRNPKSVDYDISYAIMCDSVKMLAHLVHPFYETMSTIRRHLFRIAKCGSMAIFNDMKGSQYARELISGDFYRFVKYAIDGHHIQFVIRVCDEFQAQHTHDVLHVFVIDAIRIDNLELFRYFISKGFNFEESDYVYQICRYKAIKIVTEFIKDRGPDHPSHVGYARNLYRCAFEMYFVELLGILYDSGFMFDNDIVTKSFDDNFTHALKFWGERGVLRDIDGCTQINIIGTFLLKCTKRNGGAFNIDKNFSLLLKYCNFNYAIISYNEISDEPIRRCISNGKINIISKMVAHKLLPYLEIKNLIMDRYGRRELRSFETCYNDTLSMIESSR